MRSTRFLLLQLVGALCLGLLHAEANNVALNKPVLGNVKNREALVDGNPSTAIKLNDGLVPMVAVDLQDVYRLSSIELQTQDQGSLNVPFSVYAWTNHTSVCDLEGLNPWNLVKKGLTFTSKGQVLKVEGPAEAWYLIVLTDSDDPYKTKKGIQLSELKAFGEKIRDGYRYKLPEDGTPLRNVHVETRQALLKNQLELLAQVSYMEYVVDPKYNDVSLAWRYDRVNTMAAIREKARMVLMSGPKVIERMLTWKSYEPLRNNFREWLSNKNPNAKFVNVSHEAKEGDILLITRFHDFDVEKVLNALKTGKNSAVISYISSKIPRENKVATLMQKLGIKFNHVPTALGTVNMHVSEFYYSERDVPWDFQLKIALSSWKQFSTLSMHYFVPSEQLYSTEYQQLIRQVLDKYHDLFTYLAPCPGHAYQKNNITDIALDNYNKILILQRGESSRPAPGALRSPGYVHHTAKPSSYVVEYKEDIYGSYYPMGGYAKAGEPVRYKVLEHSHRNIGTYVVQINPQMDRNFHKPSYGRWPIVTFTEYLKNEGVISSPFGGVIVLSIPENSTLKIKFENVYRYPWFDIRNKDSPKKWEEERKKYRGTPFGMVVGDSMISMLQENVLSRMDASTIEWSVNFYDNMVKTILNIRGSDYLTYRTEVLVVDDDLANGDAHSGYPWVGYRFVGELFDKVADNKAGKNFLYPHEIGHDLQVWEMTFVNGREVTNNMYIPMVNTYLCNIDGYAKGQRFSTDADFRKMVDSWKTGSYKGVEVTFYNYLARTFGPGLIANVLRHGVAAKGQLGGEQSKIAFWLKHICTESNYDLVPFHMLWHFPIDQATKDHCGKFQCWFPDDEFTKQVPDLVNKIKKSYGKECSSSQPKKVEFKIDPRSGYNTTKPQKIFIIQE